MNYDSYANSARESFIIKGLSMVWWLQKKLPEHGKSSWNFHINCFFRMTELHTCWKSIPVIHRMVILVSCSSKGVPRWVGRRTGPKVIAKARSVSVFLGRRINIIWRTNVPTSSFLSLFWPLQSNEWVVVVAELCTYWDISLDSSVHPTRTDCSTDNKLGLLHHFFIEK